MRKAEITLVSILIWIATTLAGAYIEKEFNITKSIEKTVDNNETKHKKIIITDKDR